MRWTRPLGRHAQDRHHLAGSGRLVRQYLVRRGASAAVAATGHETGIDVGLKVFLITAEGEAVENPRHYRRGEKKLAKAQRRVSRRKKGSQRRGKAVGWLAKAHIRR